MENQGQGFQEISVAFNDGMESVSTINKMINFESQVYKIQEATGKVQWPRVPVVARVRLGPNKKEVVLNRF